MVAVVVSVVVSVAGGGGDGGGRRWWWEASVGAHHEEVGGYRSSWRRLLATPRGEILSSRWCSRVSRWLGQVFCVLVRVCPIGAHSLGLIRGF